MNEVAAILKTERLRRGLTLKAASERSRISMSILKALEQRRFESIGPPSVVRGLLMEYCFALGIGEEVLKQECRISDVRNEKAVSLQPEAHPDHPKSVGKGPHRRLLPGLILGMVSIATILGFIWFSNGRSVPSGPGPSTTRSPVQEEPSEVLGQKSAQPESGETRVSASEPPQIEPPPDRALNAHVPITPEPDESRDEKPLEVEPGHDAFEASSSNAEPAVHGHPAIAVRDDAMHHLEVQADQKTWLQVVIDGKETESDLLQPGEKRGWKAKEYIKVVVGNGGGVRMKWDGNPIEVSGKPKRVIRLTLPDDYRVKR